MARKLTFLALAVGALLSAPVAMAETTQAPLKDVHWSFEGPFGKYDQAQLQRGYKVYREVCSSCHSMNMVAFRNLADPGAPFWDAKYTNSNDNPFVKSIAKDYKVSDIDADSGDVIKRPATTADTFPAPYANPAAARAANGGALPPDMSLLAKAREGGPAYIYSVVVGDGAPAPHAMTVPPGKYYDPYMPGDMTPFWKGDAEHVPVGGFIAMPPPLVAGKVTFDDGTKSSLDQEARDVAAFLEWAADPKMEQRKETGAATMIFLLIFSGLLYASYRRIWSGVGH